MSLLLTLTYFTTFSSVSIIDFEQVNAPWDVKGNKTDIRLLSYIPVLFKKSISVLFKKSIKVRKKSDLLTVALVRISFLTEVRAIQKAKTIK